MGTYTDEAIELIQNRPGFASEVARQVQHMRTLKARPVNGTYGLTPKQLELLDYIKAYRVTRNVTPTFSEMMEAMGVASKSRIHRLITALEDRGHLIKRPRYARSIVLREAA